MLDSDEIISHIHRLRKIGQDTQTCEVKEAVGKLPSSIPETMSAFANGDGGLFLLGLSEKERFAPVDLTPRAFRMPWYPPAKNSHPSFVPTWRLFRSRATTSWRHGYIQRP